MVFYIVVVGMVFFEIRFGIFGKLLLLEVVKFIEVVGKMFNLILKVYVIFFWIDKFYRLKSFWEFYDCMDVMYDFGNSCIENKLSEICRRLENGEE